jgi:hypothetical protein
LSAATQEWHKGHEVIQPDDAFQFLATTPFIKLYAGYSQRALGFCGRVSGFKTIHSITAGVGLKTFKDMANIYDFRRRLIITESRSAVGFCP